MESGGTPQIALNDLVVKSGSSGRLARFTVFAGEEPVADYACDGIVFSTPTDPLLTTWLLVVPLLTRTRGLF